MSNMVVGRGEIARMCRIWTIFGRYLGGSGVGRIEKKNGGKGKGKKKERGIEREVKRKKKKKRRKVWRKEKARE